MKIMVAKPGKECRTSEVRVNMTVIDKRSGPQTASNFATIDLDSMVEL